MSLLPLTCFFAATFVLISRGNANPFVYLDSAQDQIAISSEIMEFNSSVAQTDATEISLEDVTDLPPVQANAITCFPFAAKTGESQQAEDCTRHGCAWYPRGTGRNWESYCFTPKDYGYVMEGHPLKIENGYIVRLKKHGTKLYSDKHSENLTLTVEFQSNYRLRFAFTDGTSRWKVPIKINPTKESVKNPLYDISLTNDPLFTLKVIRKSSGSIIFDTSLGGLTFSDEFLQFATKLPSTNLYGFGEHRKSSFRHEFKTSSLRSIYSQENENKADSVNPAGLHPYYTVVENDGNTHSVLILNSNAQEVQLLPVPGFIYRTTGGILDMYVFLGPTPEETVQQYTEAIGRPFLPPYYALGLHVGKDSYSTVDEMKDILETLEKNDIPFDSFHGSYGVGVANSKESSSNNSDLIDLIHKLKEEDVHFIVTLDPWTFNTEKENNVTDSTMEHSVATREKRSEGNSMEGKVHPHMKKYPDFSEDSIKQWWKTSVEAYQDALGFDGVELENNGQGESSGKASTSLRDLENIPPNHDCHHNAAHSIYGLLQSSATVKALQISNSRSVVLSKSTFPGSGQWSGHSVTIDKLEWDSLQKGIVQLLQFNHFGIPFVGTNVKNDAENENSNSISDELFLRWIQLQAFNPLSQSPSAIDLNTRGKKAIDGMKKAMTIRYSLFPYLYTLFYDANTKGSTIIRPLWHEFRRDPVTYDVDRQFMLGSGLMIAPIMEKGATSTEAYVPRDRWYDYHTGVELTERGRHVTLTAPENQIPILIRGYHVIPTQEADLNTKLSRNNNFTLIVALCAKGNGKGHLFFDDGESFDSINEEHYFLAQYSVTNKTLTGSVVENGIPEISSRFLTAIRLLGAADVTMISINGDVHENWNSVPNSAETFITEIELPINSNFTMQWKAGSVAF